MARKKETAEQGTLEGVDVKPDLVGAPAIEYLESIGKTADAKKTQEMACATLVATMKEHRRRTINVQGKVITLRHVDAQDVLKVKKTSDR